MPCITSITRMATSQRLEPRLRRLSKASCPGVSMISSPGMFKSKSCACGPSFSFAVLSRSVERSKNVAPICCVMPPASPSCTFVWRILSSSLVLPVSTWPMITVMGQRRRSGLRAALAAPSALRRRCLQASLTRSASSSSSRSCSMARRCASSSRRFSSSRRSRSSPSFRNRSFSRRACRRTSSSSSSSSSSKGSSFSQSSFSQSSSPLSCSQSSSSASPFSAPFGASGASSTAGSGASSTAGTGAAGAPPSVLSEASTPFAPAALVSASRSLLSSPSSSSAP
mmetsp:Transcript_12973/g.48093  ORF Transcript_12973/g.48093 Transcript_12973/m.48093 type:complete len:283 (-) Transcript_12973:651-1499(-)